MTPTGAWPQGGAGLTDAAGVAAVDPTVWGLTPIQLHDRFWASRGVQVVRAGESDEPISPQAALYLLMEPGALALFDLPDLRPANFDLLYVRIHDARDRGLRERVVTDADNRFVRFERLYDRPRSRLARAALTRDAKVAATWKRSDSWKALRQFTPKSRRHAIERNGMWFDGRQPWEVAAFMRDLTRCWSDPSPVVRRVSRVAAGVWRDQDAAVHCSARLIGPVWIGRGREADAGTMVVGPTILWDDPAQRPAAEPFSWEMAPPPAGATAMLLPIASTVASERRPVYLAMKRAFDIAFALLGLAFTLPLYPFIVLAIAVEDGFPVFFIHRRETIGGREFPCLKFRSMRRNAEAMKRELLERNQADGPQFYIDHDPRLTRVGQILRRFRIDEVPQFFNVLAGHMSIVGPRPSPFRENQFCPAWRQLRLSVRPGVTGLWQVARTRAPGADFQEWIRFDIEYVENACWSLDLRILWRTLRAVLKHPAR